MAWRPEYTADETRLAIVSAPNERKRSDLEKAIDAQESACEEAIDRLREIAPDSLENEVYDLTATLRIAVRLSGCVRRLSVGRTPDEILAAFGAPGDWGYETKIGAALNRIYRGES